ncbi:hypothetical protein HZS_5726 [Henneguya salminicola]|nr:hypothetical protein HZS_5726 [Henneguya salminicola]
MISLRNFYEGINMVGWIKQYTNDCIHMALQIPSQTKKSLRKLVRDSLDLIDLQIERSGIKINEKNGNYVIINLVCSCAFRSDRYYRLVCSYSNSENYCTHQTVNHSITFRDPLNGFHTCKISRPLKAFKYQIAPWGTTNDLDENGNVAENHS